MRKLWMERDALVGSVMLLVTLAPMTSGAVEDPYYPKYHVAPPRGWFNDPHPVYFKGRYHIFYQYSSLPDDPYSGAHSWGHAASDDLVRWRHLPVALTPENHGISKSESSGHWPPHIWSGCVVDNNGVGTAVYTIDNKEVWISTSTDDDLATFTKYPDNPVIKGPPPGLPVVGFRDPCVWKEEDGWYLTIGSGLGATKGPLLPLYKSSDLIQWEYLHPLYQGEGSEFDFLGDTGFSDCPSFFPLGEKYVLILSYATTYLVGRYEEHRFIPERRGRLDHADPVQGGGIYVPQVALDGKGRPLMWGWIGLGKALGVVEGDRERMIKAGWAGMATIPRVLTLGSDGLLNYEPAEELSRLRSDHREFSELALGKDSSKILDGVKGLQLEVHASFEPGTAHAFGVEFLDGSQSAKLYYDVPTKSLRFNDTSAPLKLKRSDLLDLRVFIDAEVVEIFANKEVCITEKLQPTSPAGFRIKLFAEKGETKVRRVDVWKMGTIW